MSNLLIVVLAVVGGLYMAWNIGANDVANAMGTSVGSKAITLKQAILVAAIFEFGGAVLVGSHVTSTIQKGIVNPALFASVPHQYVIGMLAALLSAGIWLQLATFWGLPVSTTHSIVGSVMGFGIVCYGFKAIEWGKVVTIVASWGVSPIAGGILAFLTFKLISRLILESPKPIHAVHRFFPYLTSVVFALITLSFTYKGLKNLHLHLSFGVALSVALAMAVVGWIGSTLFLARRRTSVTGVPLRQRLRDMEEVFKYLQVMTACCMAFAHGANDVANATGPLAGIFMGMKQGMIASEAHVPVWVLLVGGAGIVIGLATWGYKVIETVGRKITDINPSRGFSAEFGCATTVLVCSRMGLPISTTHTLVGAVIGVGLARGISALNLRVIRDIWYSWLITIPFTAGLSAILFSLMR